MTLSDRSSSSELGALATDRGVGRLRGFSSASSACGGRIEVSRASGLSGRIAASRSVTTGSRSASTRTRCDRVVGGRLRLGDDEGDGMTDEQRLVAGERLEHPHVVGAGDRQVGGGQDGDDAGHRRGRRTHRSRGSGHGRRRSGRSGRGAGPNWRWSAAKRVVPADLLLRVDPRPRHADEARGVARDVNHIVPPGRARDLAASVRLSTIQPRPVKAGVEPPPVHRASTSMSRQVASQPRFNPMIAIRETGLVYRNPRPELRSRHTWHPTHRPVRRRRDARHVRHRRGRRRPRLPDVRHPFDRRRGDLDVARSASSPTRPAARRPSRSGPTRCRTARSSRWAR